MRKRKINKHYFEKLNSNKNGILLEVANKLKLWNNQNYKTYFFDNLR